MTVQTMSVFGQQFRYTRNNPVFEKHIISSKILNEERKIAIYTPEIFPEYSNAVIPVIYVLDGDAFMNYISSIVNIYCERLVQLPPIRVVSIENFIKGDFNSRDRDFRKGEDNFVRFLTEEVIPFAEKDYKKRPYRIIVGHSLSGVFVVDAFLKYPTLFNAYLASSPGGDSCNLVNEEYLRKIDSAIANSSQRSNRFFLCGGNEPWAPSSIKIVETLFQKKQFKDFSYRINSYPGESHFEVFMKAYYDGLRYIFMVDPEDSLKDSRDMTPQSLEDHYKKVSKIFGFSMKAPEIITEHYAEAFLNQWNDLDKAIAFYKMTAENCPESGWCQIQYADALLKKGDKKNAIMAYEKALALDPTDTSLKETINKLKSEQ
jgi:predicted alpha/beta superfamily hydrolase